MTAADKSRKSAYVIAGWLVALTAACCIPQALSAAESPARYTLFVELQRPYEQNRATLQKILQNEGHESFVERDEEIALALTAAQIEKLFQARVTMRKVEASATRGMITQPALESYKIPARFKKLIRSVYFDPQRG